MLLMLATYFSPTYTESTVLQGILQQVLLLVMSLVAVDDICHVGKKQDMLLWHVHPCAHSAVG